MKHFQNLWAKTKAHFSVVTLGLISLIASPTLIAQSQGNELCTVGAQATISCDKVTVQFSGNPTWPTHFWDFGDGTVISGGPELTMVNHDYVDINPYAVPLSTAAHSLNGIDWCYRELQEFLPGIFIGTGCGSTRTVSNLVANSKLPTNELVGKTLYVFGSLEVDASYTFDACSIFISEGGKIIVKSGATLTLKNNTIVDAHFISGSADCQSLWNGIEVFSGGSLTTDGATIQNAYFAVRPIQNNPTLFPVLRLKNTTFKRDFVGIYAVDGNFVLADFRNNTFEGSGNSPIYNTSTCSQVNGLPFAQRTYCGIYFHGALISSLLMPNKSINNVFKNLQAGIVCISGTSVIRGCRFENIAFVPNNTALHQGIAITFIDSIGKKGLTVVGLGKFGQATVENCEQGIYATTLNRPAAVNISNCRMIEVQNGIEIDASGIGNFSKGTIKDNYIGCTKFFGIIKQRSTGIEWKDPSILLSDFSITGNDIEVDQPEAYSPFVDTDILPIGIKVVAMHNQAADNAMVLNIGSNNIDLIKGHRGIVAENVANAIIVSNFISNENAIGDGVPLAGIYVSGGLNNTLICNSAIDNTFAAANMVAIACDASPGITVTQNTSVDFLGSISFRFDNGTDCIVSYNDIETVNAMQHGIFYSNAQTGPQYLRGNDWIGDFFDGALFLGDAFSYCNSRYHVSPQANVNNAINPVNQGPVVSCPQPPNNWFTTIGTQEDDYFCGGPGGGSDWLYKNEADLNLANGGTLGLNPGYKWSSEIGLYRKFTDNPDLIGGDAVISGFLQTQQGLPTAAMYAVQNGVRDIEGNIPATLAGNIENTLAQLEATEADMVDLLEDIETDPNALASYTVLDTQIKNLEILLESYLSDALNSMVQNATPVWSANDNIKCSDQPCFSERYINGLYLETQIIAPRTLTIPELESVEAIALSCPKDAGNIVYLARAWYYFQTGEMLHTDCGHFTPAASGERTAPLFLLLKAT